MTAFTAAKRGVSVLQVERNPVFGAVQRCAEGVLQQQLHLYMEPKSEIIRTKIHGVTFYAPDCTPVSLNRPNSGYIIDRKKFDALWASYARDAGAEQWCDASCAGISRTRDGVTAIINKNGISEQVSAPLIVGADGIESRVVRWAGLGSALTLAATMCCYQGIVRHEKIVTDRVAMFMGKAIAPGGYGWIFPRGDGMANAGVTISGTNNKQDTARHFFESFLKASLPGAEVFGQFCGGYPTFVKDRKLAGDRVMLAGDAGCQVNPLSGAGILEALRAGVLAGEVIGDALKAGDFSERFLCRYQKGWDNFLGKKHARFQKLKDSIMRMDDSVFNHAAKMLNKVDPAHLGIREIFKEVLLKNPRLILELRHLF
jgi:digeranylgeranylglycerophospholipid reductase